MNSVDGQIAFCPACSGSSILEYSWTRAWSFGLQGLFRATVAQARRLLYLAMLVGSRSKFFDQLSEARSWFLLRFCNLHILCCMVIRWKVLGKRTVFQYLGSNSRYML
jgi:hypothetical protein